MRSPSCLSEVGHWIGVPSGPFLVSRTGAVGWTKRRVKVRSIETQPLTGWFVLSARQVVKRLHCCADFVCWCTSTFSLFFCVLFVWGTYPRDWLTEFCELGDRMLRILCCLETSKMFILFILDQLRLTDGIFWIGWLFFEGKYLYNQVCSVGHCLSGSVIWSFVSSVVAKILRIVFCSICSICWSMPSRLPPFQPFPYMWSRVWKGW